MSYSEIKVTKMEWLSKEGNEAIVSFKYNNKEYKAFGHPVDFEPGNIYKVEFGYLDGVDISWDTMFSENKDRIKDLVIKPNSNWSYSAYGQVLSIKPVVVDCGIAKFDIGNISRDERIIGEYVFFDIARLDIHEC